MPTITPQMKAITLSGLVMVTVSIVVVGAILSGEGPRLLLGCSGRVWYVYAYLFRSFLYRLRCTTLVPFRIYQHDLSLSATQQLGSLGWGSGWCVITAYRRQC